MSDKSSIEWTEATWNPVTGCTKVSPGCATVTQKHSLSGSAGFRVILTSGDSISNCDLSA